VIGTLIIIVGVGIFGTFTGYLANLFLSPSKKEAVAGPSPTVDDAQLKLGQLKELVAQQQAAIDELNLLLEADGR
jgi:voltage-gated potassium channel